MSTQHSDAGISFGEFTFLPARRLLSKSGQPVRLGSRSTDILTLLISKAGEIVSKEELIAFVWPDTFVDDGNLRVHLTTLRKTLGDGLEGARYIATVPNRGYSFVAELTPNASSRQSDEDSLVGPRINLPLRLNRIFGREQAIAGIAEQLQTRRLVTIVGAGGIGKTTVAVAVANEIRDRHADGVAFIDLGPVFDADHLAGSVGLVLGCQTNGHEQQRAVVAHLAQKKMLIVLDNCEQVIGAVADLVEAVLRQAPDVRILATSREPLRAEGEWLHRLNSLQVPPAELAAESARQYSAVQLFSDRLASAGGALTLSDEDLDLMAEICRQLDGIPLAIELAAARVDLLGLRGISSRLDDRFRILTKGRRMALPRHQTLQAAVDWSYQLLPLDERQIFERLSVFPSRFDMEAATVVGRGGDLDDLVTMEGVANLVAKSLVSPESRGGRVRYHLLNTFRAFGLEMLRGRDGERSARSSHALYVLARLKALFGDQASVGIASLDEGLKDLLDDVRVAIDWALSCEGDHRLAVELTALAIPLGLRLSLLSEFRRRIAEALAVSEDTAASREDVIRLHIANGHFSRQVLGASPQVAASFQRGLQLAKQVGSRIHQQNALLGIWTGAFGAGDYPEAARLADEIASLEGTEGAGPFRSVALRIRAQTDHFLGQHAKSLESMDAALAAWDSAAPPSPDAPIQVRPDLSMGILRARILWMQGKPGQASAAVEALLVDALGEFSFAAAQALALAAIPIALWRGDLEEALGLVGKLRDQAQLHSSAYWQTWADFYGGVLAGQQVRPVDAKQSDMLVTLADLLPAKCKLEFGNRGFVGWSEPEALRFAALRSLEEGQADPKDALTKLEQAIAIARHQGNRAFELRSCIAVASALKGSGDRVRAIGRVRSVLDQYEEGWKNPDVLIALSLVEAASA